MKTLKDLIKEYPEYFPNNSLGFYCRYEWVFLIEHICQYVKNKQDHFLTLSNPTKEACAAKSDRPLFKFHFQQIKEKFSELRIYSSLNQEEHDWNRFDPAKYISQFSNSFGEVQGFISAMEIISGEICGVTGQQATSDNLSEEDREEIDTINQMDRIEMCWLWRFAPSGHKYFDMTKPFFEVFDKRFKELGGFSPEISKLIGW